MEALLGIDLGSVRIGVAICERLDLPALPLQTIAHTNRRDDVAAIAHLARERGASTIVVGYPLRLDGSIGHAATDVDRFIAALRTVYSGRIEAVDERLTSAAAAKRLRTSTLSGSKRRRVGDQLAAVEILETYRARRAAST